jgi:hypothetical protein
VVALVQPQPLWNGAALFVESFHRIQVLPIYFAYLLATGSILMLASVYLLSKRRATALAALIFASLRSCFIGCCKSDVPGRSVSWEVGAGMRVLSVNPNGADQNSGA